MKHLKKKKIKNKNLKEKKKKVTNFSYNFLYFP